MIGYSHNGYILWNPITRKVINARNVDFDETKTIRNLRRIKNNNSSENLTLIEIIRSEKNLENLNCLDDNDIN